MSLSNLAHIKKKSLEKSQQVQKSGTKPKSKKSYLYVRLLFFRDLWNFPFRLSDLFAAAVFSWFYHHFFLIHKNITQENPHKFSHNFL